MKPDKTGRVFLVGAGPGDPELITVRGRRLLAAADVVVYDHLASPHLLNAAPPAAERIYVGKQSGRHSLPQPQINALLIEKARQGLSVVRLKGGDPFVFGRGGEEAEALAAAGVPFEVVPGVTAALAAAACAGIPLTHRDWASTLALITGHEDPERLDDTRLDWAALGRWRGTLAFYMGVKNLPFICRTLQENGLAPDTPAALISWGATPRQRTAAGTLATLPQLAQEQAFTPPAIVIVGQVVQLRKTLAWFEKRPLFGRRIVVTRPRTQAGELLERLAALGADVLECPVIRVAPPPDPTPLRHAAREVNCYDWLVLTSVNGVEAFFAALQTEGLDARRLAGVKVCAIGPATAQRLRDCGIAADLVPPQFLAEAILQTLHDRGEVRTKRFLLARADAARHDLADGLRRGGAQVHEITAYCTLPDDPDLTELRSALQADQIDWITFTSSSTVRNFLDKLDLSLLRGKKTRLASIGPVTSATIKQMLLPVSAEAAEHTIDGLVAALLQAEAAAPRPSDNNV